MRCHSAGHGLHSFMSDHSAGAITVVVAPMARPSHAVHQENEEFAMIWMRLCDIRKKSLHGSA